MIIDIKKQMICGGDDCFENNRFNNSLNEEYIAHFSYKGLSIEQNPDVYYPFLRLLETVRPDRILEIGTFSGGFTLFIRDILNNIGLEKTLINTYDINKSYLPNDIKNLNVYTENLFNDDYSDFVSDDIEGYIRDYIKQNGKTLILCDGGNKKNEFNLLCKFLKPDDIIMAHDYSYNYDFFNKNIAKKYWNWLEIEDKDIDTSCEIYNLKPYMQDSFINVAWVCKIKK